MNAAKLMFLYLIYGIIKIGDTVLEVLSLLIKIIIIASFIIASAANRSIEYSLSFFRTRVKPHSKILDNCFIALKKTKFTSPRKEDILASFIKIFKSISSGFSFITPDPELESSGLYKDIQTARPFASRKIKDARKKVAKENHKNELLRKKYRHIPAQNKEIILFDYSKGWQEGYQRSYKIMYNRKQNPILNLFYRRSKRKVGRPTKRKPFLNFGNVFYPIKFFILGTIFSFIFLFLPILVFVFASDLPNPYTLSASSLPKTTKIFDRDGKLLYEIYANQNRTIVKLNEIPEILQQATIAIEDKNFYVHPGFDLRGIIRAAFRNIQNDDLQGGSTITQQLIKSAYLTPAPTIQRKMKEIVLALWAERVYSKNQILELYFNYVPYGGTAWGIQSATEVYFGKNVRDVTLAEAAFLAGMPKAPSVYSPYSSTPNRWKKRQKEVLDAMFSQGFVTKTQRDNALKQQLVFKSPKVPLKAPHFVMYIKDLLIKKYGISDVEKGGLRVTTTLDLALQQEVEKIVKEEVEKNKYLNISNGASLITDPQSGDILAMIGGKDYFDEDGEGNVNVATSQRQPGSTIKLVTYSLALTSGKFTEASILDDSPLSVKLSDGKLYTPVNYDGKSHGKIPLRIAFANSFNITAVRTAQQLGVDSIVKFGKLMGVSSWDERSDFGLSVTLGGAEVTMLDLATAFGTIANKGEKMPLDPLLEIKDSTGNLIYQKIEKGIRVVDEGVAFIISDILSDDNARSIEFGANSPLNIPSHKVSVKTGTSDNKRDNWTVGFSNSFLVATWVGNNDNTPMSQNLTSGITGAAPMWNRIMNLLLQGLDNEPVKIPSNVVRKNCLGRDYYFIRGTENLVDCTPRLSITPTINFSQPQQQTQTIISPPQSQDINSIISEFIKKRNDRRKKQNN